ncbi:MULTISPECIES: tetratricopeptide repeat protein [unclassified Stenotrophomonas]|uniref:tetratricopeptide repeat protein n=1 Tax=unclassified Stenotrophomonas TaxID=196198 RepID=UPI00190B2465|nr:MULTISPECIES: tetratricopeptide repeat protein [unclassified Stenotrophomonas]MBK0053978.1 tetratricopeptide repeat protein [Stenotrophomonas sp. S39]MDI9273231.1 tetratricopeptide repeat protein [Stenotrophomonas sp. PFBMAA-4]
MIFRNHKAVLSVLIATALTGAVVTDAFAQSSRSSERGNRGGKQAKAEVLFPNATREEPKEKASSKMSSKLQKLIDNYNDQKFPETLQVAGEILGNSASNNYDKSLAAQLASQAAYQTDDTAGAIRYLKQALELNGLDNNGHFQAMLMLGQLQLQEDQTAEGLVTLDKYFAESKSTKPEELIAKGQALYQLERYQEAIPVIQQAIAGSTEPKDNWNQLLMAALSEAGQTGEALKTAEALAAKNPNDKKAQLNLANMYMQADQMPKAAAVMDKLRSSGQLTEEREYKQLYSIYANTENKEKDVIAVINEGMQKGILKPDYQVYLALAQSYYYSDQVPQAIDAWQKAAPLSKDGETYLNLARVLHAEGRVPEAKQAAQQALAKGVKNQADAKKIINLK